MRRYSSIESELAQRLTWRERHGWEADRRTRADWREAEHLLNLVQRVRSVGTVEPTTTWLVASKSRLLTRFDQRRLQVVSGEHRAERSEQQSLQA